MILSLLLRTAGTFFDLDFFDFVVDFDFFVFVVDFDFFVFFVVVDVFVFVSLGFFTLPLYNFGSRYPFRTFVHSPFALATLSGAMHLYEAMVSSAWCEPSYNAWPFWHCFSSFLAITQRDLIPSPPGWKWLGGTTYLTSLYI